MTIEIEALTFEVIIGLLDFERERPQRIIVDIEASYDYTGSNFVNYADMVSDIQEELKKKKYTLLEDALLGVKNKLHTKYPQIHDLQIKISKPDILKECTVALRDKWKF